MDANGNISFSDILQLYRDNSDIRQEVADKSSDLRREVAKEAGVLGTEIAQGLDNVNSDVKTTGWAVREALNASDNHQTALQAQYYIAGSQKHDDILASIAAAAAATALDAAKNAAAIQLDAAKNAAAVTASVVEQSAATRALINSQMVDTLNRKLIEQNARLVEAREESRYQSLYAQIAAVNSQVNNTKDQLINFGSMAAGAGTQTSTSNNVK